MADRIEGVRGWDELEAVRQANAELNTKLGKQAAEIKRLEAELDEWKEQARFAIENEMRRQAQLAAMRAALESIAANTCCEKCQEAALVARQALATDASKAGR